MEKFLEKLAASAQSSGSSEHLKLLGKRAAGTYVRGDAGSLNDAVHSAISDEGLNRDQVRRVSEMANQATWQSLFIDGGDKEVHFDPADSSEVLGMLSEKPDIAYEPILDYHKDPIGEQVSDDIDLESAFGIKADDSESLAQLNPAREEAAEVEKTAAALDVARYGADKVASELRDVGERFFQMVKQAHLQDGHGILQISRAVSEVTHSPTFASDLMQKIASRLEAEGVRINKVAELEKLAQPVVVDTSHPLLEHAALVEKLAYSYHSALTAQDSLKDQSARAMTALRDKTRGV